MVDYAEKRNLRRLEEFGDLITSVCNHVDDVNDRIERLELWCGYWRAIALGREELVKVLADELNNIIHHRTFRSLDELEDADLINSRDVAFCRNYEEIVDIKK